MFYYFFPKDFQAILPFFGAGLSFIFTLIFLRLLNRFLPKDQGRAFAVNGEKSEGKPRGAGIIFVTIFALVSLIFVPLSLEHIIYILLVYFAMMTGFMDDRSEKPWSRWIKGALDLIISGGAVATYLIYNKDTIVNGAVHIQLLYNDKLSFNIPIVLFVILAVLLIWVSINVTNCTDGVDGLSGSIAIISMLSIYGIMLIKGSTFGLNKYTCSGMLLVFIAAMVAYLWFNAFPSKLLMGDAGSRAIGFFIALMCIKTGSPLLYIPVAIVFIIDGGIGLVKIILIKVFKCKNALKNIRTPLHDHMRKNKGWSDTQTVFRFTIMQVVVSVALIGAAYLI